MRLVFAIKLASDSPDSSSRLAMLKPVNIKSDEEWNDFLKEKLSENFEVIRALSVINSNVNYILLTKLSCVANEQ